MAVISPPAVDTHPPACYNHSRLMKEMSNLKNLWQGIGRLSRGQKLLVGILFLVVITTWLAAGALIVSIFV